MIYYLNIILYLFLSPLPSIFGKSTMDKFQTTITNHIQSSSVLNPHICPACGKHFSTESGANKHLSQSHKCAWYNKIKYQDLTVYPDTEDYGEDLPHDDDITQPPIFDDILPNAINQDNKDEIINVQNTNRSSTPQSSNYTSLEDDSRTGELYYEDYPDTGKILGVQETTQQQWNKTVSPIANTNIFHPFESELDWKMAEWLIDNGPSQSANNQLLKILQVSIILFLSIFTNNISIF